MSLKKNKLKVLGTYGSRFDDMHTTCFLINDCICIDAGNILEPLKEKAKDLKHILLTHSHLDHILDIPFLSDITLNFREFSLNIWGLEETINDLKNYIMNWHIWPDFSSIKLIRKKDNPALHYNFITYNEEIFLENIKFKTVKSNHSVPTVGYVINDKIFISGDTINNEELIKEVNNNLKIEKLFIDVSFPSYLDKVAKDSKHHSTLTFKEEIKKIREDVEVYIYHIKPPFINDIKKELESCSRSIKFLKEGDIFEF